ncbi:hypothetical protein AMD24_00294 [Candidatus Xiphinematobacter sp. Idaho Grape]|uniref:hypothetical protein n=1 Tax=Candidatus Xiphinematobacter sp. Idaho Grape TaxID=1704307 RepID=UPI000706E2CC|nr:hypothetical protein [Candidatus Xiphinematobacter sp. Idaho Grape]ALJ56478.1 hypothetical protein AMD24_00294 [Candidatus Xiphinematobacter sp. Idaho Grape]
MEQVLKDFGNLLGLSNLVLPPGKSVRLRIESLGELDLIHKDSHLLMRLSKTLPSFSKETLLELLSATHFFFLSTRPVRVWIRNPDRLGIGLLFSQQEATAHCLYQGLELLGKEFRRICP